MAERHQLGQHVGLDALQVPLPIVPLPTSIVTPDSTLIVSALNAFVTLSAEQLMSIVSVDSHGNVQHVVTHSVPATGTLAETPDGKARRVAMEVLLGQVIPLELGYVPVVLRSQAQAIYSPDNLGHFGLALRRYAHFTSPIRRYADLLVHRALVSAYKLGEGGLPPGEDEKFVEIGEQISMLERRAMEAERDTIDRYVAAFLSDRVGQLVECRITGVQPFGFFATVTDLGGDGLVLAQTLGQEYFRYDEAARQLVGEDSGETYRVGQRLTLRLAEANPVSGSLRFELPEGSYGGPPKRGDRVRGGQRRGRPANIRHQGRTRR